MVSRHAKSHGPTSLSLCCGGEGEKAYAVFFTYGHMDGLTDRETYGQTGDQTDGCEDAF